MNRLLSANFTRLIKDKFFGIGMIFMSVMGIYMTVMRYISTKEYGIHISLDTGFFNYTLYAVIVLSVFASLFIGTEYSDGTIRNKIIIGHKRTDIYLTNLLVCIAAGFLICIAYIVPALIVGIPLLGFFEVEIQTILLTALCIFVMTIAFSAIFTMIAMLNQSKAAIAVISILGVFVLLFIGIYIQARLNEPETYDAYSYTVNGENVSVESEPNPYYIGGTKRDVYEFLYDFLPGCQAVKLSNMIVPNPINMSLYSVCIAAAATGFGLILFRKKDLK